MDAGLRELVRQRAGDCCEYCRLPQKVSELRFHVEHVIPRQHGGSDEFENLALACPECNLHKTDVGRTTVQLLDMNDSDRVTIREGLRAAGQWP
jgi:5-methylcytosine-specific restriction endonuclease McrA